MDAVLSPSRLAAHLHGRRRPSHREARKLITTFAQQQGSIYQEGAALYVIIVSSPDKPSAEGRLIWRPHHGLGTDGPDGLSGWGQPSWKAPSSWLEDSLEVVGVPTLPAGTGQEDSSADGSPTTGGRTRSRLRSLMSWWWGLFRAEAIPFTRQMRELDVNVRSAARDAPEGPSLSYAKALGRHGKSSSRLLWEPGLPYPGNQGWQPATGIPHAPASSAASYAGCQLFVDAVKRANSLDSDQLREALLKLKTQTVFGDFAVDNRRLPGRAQSRHHPVAGWQVGSGLARRSSHRVSRGSRPRRGASGKKRVAPLDQRPPKTGQTQID